MELNIYTFIMILYSMYLNIEMKTNIQERYKGEIREKKGYIIYIDLSIPVEINLDIKLKEF